MFSRAFAPKRLHCHLAARLVAGKGNLGRKTNVLGGSLTVRGMASSTQGKRRFAPLGTNSTGGSDDGAQQLRGIVFDMDGTLCMFISHFPFLVLGRGRGGCIKTIAIPRDSRIHSPAPSPLRVTFLFIPPLHLLTEKSQASPKTTCSAKCAPR